MTRFLPGATLVGMQPMRAPATAQHVIPQLYAPQLPDLAALASDPGAYEDAVLDMAANALRIADDRDALAASQPHLEAVCKLFEDRDRQLVSAQADVAAARQERDAYRRALAQEQADKAKHVRGLEAEILRLQAVNAKRCRELDAERRLNLALSARLLVADAAEERVAAAEASAANWRATARMLNEGYHDILAELLERDAADAAEHPVPPAHDDFGSAPVFLARGTNPENETVVVDVPFRGAL